MGSCSFPVLVGLFFLQIHQISECQKLELTPDPGTTIQFNKKTGQGLDCSVCKDEDPSTCNSNLKLTVPQPAVVTFNCSQPGDIYTVKINQDIDCSSWTCSNIAVHPTSTRFLEFSRTFNWELKVQSSKMIQLDFPAPGMKQIKPSETCPDKHTYTIVSYLREGLTPIGTFCRNGTINRIQVLYRGRVSLDIPKGTELSPSDFKISIGSDKTGLVEMDIKMPRGEASADFFTPNYDTGYYTQDKIKWNFDLDAMHNFTVNFPQYTPPECQKTAVSVDYMLKDETTFSKTPTDTQPVNKKGDFSLTLNNCDARKGVPGLSLNVNLKVFRGGTPYVCSVDLQKEEGLSLQIENKNPQSFCEMTLNSEVQEKIVVPAGTKADLSFLDCPTQDLQLTATKTIDLAKASSRTIKAPSLIIPPLDFGLPVPLQQFSWLLRVSDQSTVDLMSPSEKLFQSVPGQECKGRVSLLVSETEGSRIGDFCSQSDGTIEKIQIRSNVTITATPKGAKDLSLEKGTILNVATSPEITENVIIFVSPLIFGPTYLATPNWPDGMSPSSSAVWMVSFPSEYKANLYFTNTSRPTCYPNHAEVEVSPLGSTSETQSWREDKSLPPSIIQQRSFSLNVSNCEPQSGRLAFTSSIILQKDNRSILGIILGVVGVVLAVVIIVLVVVCVTKKKKKANTSRSSIYMPKAGGAAFLPGSVTYGKSREDNESPVYASIDDAPYGPTYGRHLDKSQPAENDSGTWSNGHQVDAYRPFPGPVEPAPPAMDSTDGYGEKDVFQSFLSPPNTFNLPRPRSPFLSQGSLGFEDRRMAVNEFNTFKNTGDVNPIRLSADTSKLQPLMNSDSDSNHEAEYDEAS